MTPLSFKAKRVHWAMTWFGIRDFRKAALAWKVPELERMTPARYDILYVMFLEKKGFWRRPQVLQSDLTERLGLHRSTISKTVAGLVRLGFVKRQEHDPGRSHWLELTALGLRAIEAAMRRVLGERRLDRHLRAFAAPLVAAGATCMRFAVAAVLSLVTTECHDLATTFGVWSEPLYCYLPLDER